MYVCLCVCGSLLIVNMHTKLCALVRVFIVRFPMYSMQIKSACGCSCMHLCECVCVCVMRELRVYTHKKDIASLMPVKKLRAVIMQIIFRVWDTESESCTDAVIVQYRRGNLPKMRKTKTTTTDEVYRISCFAYKA